MVARLFPHAGKDILQAKLWFGRLQSEGFTAPHSLDEVRGRNEGLRRDAAEIQAVAAHLVGFDERRPATQAGSPSRGHQASGAGADHDDVVLPLAFLLRVSHEPPHYDDMGVQSPVSGPTILALHPARMLFSLQGRAGIGEHDGP